MKKTLVIAFGGNALLDDSGNTSFSYQYSQLTTSIHHIADLHEAGWKILIVHGNGPQVGFTLRRSELARHEVSPIPLDYAVAESQGSIGYMFQRALFNEFQARQKNVHVCTMLTQALVDANDPAFLAPSKPVGGFMEETLAVEMQKTLGWAVMEDSGRGWRRTVASPKPLRIIESDSIRALLEQDRIVIAGGGGGIAVAKDQDGKMIGIEAVIDKDLSAALLAVELKADCLIIPTAVPQVAINFGKLNQEWLSRLSAKDAQRLLQENQFGKGSMQPKIEALLSYVSQYHEGCGIITNPASMLAALEGNAGTRLQWADFSHA